MSRRQSYFAYFALLVGVLTFASSFSRKSSGQLGAGSPTTPGRYQATSAAYHGSPPSLFITDTHTGQTWRRDNPEWTDLGTPPTKR
jgi:hypothetical protein